MKRTPPPRLARGLSTAGSRRKNHGDGAQISSSISERAANIFFPIVGVGASAGGLETFTELFRELPSDTGMAFVLIQHLDPTHTSFLAEALTNVTPMAVTQAKHGDRVEPNHIYVIPPNADLAILRGALMLHPRDTEERKLHLAVDFFFRSLAEERGSHAIGVILSGTASDGTAGLKAIKDQDGITFAQDPKTAKFDGMPRSAIDAGVVDYILPIPDLARELLRLSKHPYVSALEKQPSRPDVGTIGQIFGLIRHVTGVDFSEYKAPTFERRLARRMALRKIERLTEYLELLRTDPKEIHSLYEDVLIHVTSFFRDPEVFSLLAKSVFPEILRHKSAGDPLRLWVAGCASGEEVYSLAISLLEFLGDSYGSHPIQIFGSDVSERAIEKARTGTYPEAAVRQMTDERHRHFFNKVDSGYRINKTVRDLCVFVRHDLARDPPFSKLDLVSCRNVLIYFGQALQKRVIPTFHYALNPGGVLLLGRTESISGFSRFFSPSDRSKKVFVRTAGASALQFAPRAEGHPVAPRAIQPVRPELPPRGGDLARRLDRLLLTKYAPPGVLINERMEILHFCGDTGAYLRPAPGEPQNDLLKMAREGLGPVLRGAIAKVKRIGEPVELRRVAVGSDKSVQICDLVVLPFTLIPDAKEHLFLVLFEPPRARGKGALATLNRSRTETLKEQRAVVKLERELSDTREYLQSLIDTSDRSNDDLHAANEELVSGNEELQSMNEELETAKEELQSTNEELSTVNDELNVRNQEAREANGDLVNLLATVDVPILILDRERRIRRFTPKARTILKVLASDIGRPLGDIASSLDLSDLDQRVAHVIETNEIHESEVQDRHGRWFRMQIRPYRTVENKIDGAVLSLVDIHALRQLLDQAEQARQEAEQATRAKDEFLATLSHEIRTPLSSMLLQAQQLGRGAPDLEKVQQAGEVLERGIKMQVKLIDDLLDVSRIVSGMLKIESKPVDLRAVIGAALEGVNAPAERRKLTFQVLLADSIGVVTGDPGRLQQVVSNLLSNAVKFSPDGGQVVVRLDEWDGQARIQISDTGIGIEPTFLPHIFDRFSQEDGSTVRRHGGLGLGLAIVHHLVEAHGGSIHGESAGKGRGAVFTVVLPLSVASVGKPEELAPGRHLRPLARPLESDGLLRNLRILVVDDDLETRDVVAEILRKTGAEVSVAESAAEALTAVQKFRPDVLMCDIAMPREDGYSLIRRLRGTRGGENLPAIAMTAMVGEKNRQKALSAGFQMYLEKPFDVDRVTCAVAELSHRTVGPALGSQPASVST